MNEKIEMFGETNFRFLVTLIKNELLKYYDKDGVDTAINDAMQAATGITFKKVNELPTEESEVDKSAIYMVPEVNQTEGTNKYIEYFWDDSEKRFEPYGSSLPNLSDYVQKSDMKSITNSELQTIWDSVFLGASLEGE